MKPSRTWIVLGLFVVAFWIVPGNAFAEEPAAAEAEAEEEENPAKFAPPGGFRQGVVTPKTVDVFLDGAQVGTITAEELEKLSERRIFSPRGPKKAWPVVDAIKNEGVKSAKHIRFINDAGKTLDLEWADVVRNRDTVVVGYNFFGELVLETDVNDKVPDHAKDADEDRVREEMHKKRQRSLIFLRNLSRIELTSN